MPDKKGETMEIEKRVELIEAFINETLNNVSEREIASQEKHEKLYEAHNRHYLIVASMEIAGIWAIAILLFLGA